MMDKDNPMYLTDISEVEKSTNGSRLIQQFNTKIFMKRRKKSLKLQCEVTHYISAKFD